ncbi:MAG TPA: carboxypeptidase-like regulatory domain-containing protein, partial [Candidatus Acidoferrales bacterium]|nr:carboxypeptidase-like regulatory domain-containing protein [Candidatus Acidoferrales bacterium]
VEITAADSDQPVAEADVLVLYVSERGTAAKRIEANVKTDARGIAQVTGIPAGKIFLRVVAKGFKKFYRWYECAGEKQTIPIRLEKLPRWEGKPN